MPLTAQETDEPKVVVEYVPMYKSEKHGWLRLSTWPQATQEKAEERLAEYLDKRQRGQKTGTDTRPIPETGVFTRTVTYTVWSAV